MIMILYDVGLIDEHDIGLIFYVNSEYTWYDVVWRIDIYDGVFYSLLDYAWLWGLTWELHLYDCDGIKIKGLYV